MTITAWYPASASPNGTIPNFTVQTDQSNFSRYTVSDLMTSTIIANSKSTAGKTVNLVFVHRMAQLRITFVDKTGNAVKPAITVNNVCLDVNKTKTGSITASTSANSGTTYDVLVPPQTIAAGTTLVTFATSSGKKWSYVTDKGLALTAGNSYPITCTLTPVSITTGEGDASGADPKGADAKSFR